MVANPSASRNEAVAGAFPGDPYRGPFTRAAAEAVARAAAQPPAVPPTPPAVDAAPVPAPGGMTDRQAFVIAIGPILATQMPPFREDRPGLAMAWPAQLVRALLEAPSELSLSQAYLWALRAAFDLPGAPK